MPLAYYDKGTLRLSWLALSAVRYDLEHMEYLLPLLPLLRQGIYFPEPGESAAQGKPGQRHTASFESACQVAAEIFCRLAMCFHSHGSDRPYIEAYYCDGMSLKQLHVKYGLDERDIDSRIRSAPSVVRIRVVVTSGTL